MKKVLVYGMTDNRGGIEAYLMNLYRNMDKDRLMFDFVTDFPSMAYDDEVLAAGSQIHYIPSKSSSPVGHLRAFAKVLREHPEYESVYFNVLNAGAAFTMTVVRLYKRKIIVHSHNGSDDKMQLHRFFFSLLQRLADQKLACSAIAAKFMFGTTENVTLINNAVKLQNFAFSQELRTVKRQELGLENGSLTILHVGRMTKQKNPLFIIRVFSEVLKLCPDAVLLYAGTGDMEMEVKEFARELDVDTKIRFLGMRHDVNELYNAADVFFLPSLYEGLPVVLIEAQANGLPCISSQNVSSAAAITSSISFLSLDQCETFWAEQILNAAKQGRRDELEHIKAAGYSIEEIASQIQLMLLNGDPQTSC